MYRNILLPTDGLGTCAYGTCHGVLLAKSLGAKVTAVCVTKQLSLQEIMRAYHPETEWRVAFSQKAPDVVEQARQIHGELLDKALKAAERMCADSGVPCATVLFEDDNAVDGLLRVAEKEGCDLIFVSTHGNAGIMGKLFGTMATTIVANSKIPVLVHHCGGPA